jgi:hypothetical protein
MFKISTAAVLLTLMTSTAGAHDHKDLQSVVGLTAANCSLWETKEEAGVEFSTYLTAGVQGYLSGLFQGADPAWFSHNILGDSDFGKDSLYEWVTDFCANNPDKFIAHAVDDYASYLIDYVEDH